MPNNSTGRRLLQTPPATSLYQSAALSVACLPNIVLANCPASFPSLCGFYSLVSGASCNGKPTYLMQGSSYGVSWSQASSAWLVGPPTGGCVSDSSAVIKATLSPTSASIVTTNSPWTTPGGSITGIYAAGTMLTGCALNSTPTVYTSPLAPSLGRGGGTGYGTGIGTNTGHNSTVIGLIVGIAGGSASLLAFSACLFWRRRQNKRKAEALALQPAASIKSKAPTRPAPVARAVQLNPIYSQQPMRARFVNPNQQRAAKFTRRASLESITAAGRPAVQEKWTGLTDYQVCDILARSLFEGRYFVNPAGMATNVFAEDCVFKDPFGVIVGLPEYLASLGIRFDPHHSHVELLDVAVPSPRTITATWMLGGYLGLPVDSRIYPVFEFVPPFQGWVTYLLNDTGLVAFQEQTWSIYATGPGMETTPMPGAYLPGINYY